MKEYIKTTKVQEDRPVGSLKRDRWQCVRIKDRVHKFRLKTPDYAFFGNKQWNSPKEYYEFEDQRDLQRGGYHPRTRWWACVYCGFIQVDSETNPNKKIREKLYDME